jgi:hypothetical protein
MIHSDDGACLCLAGCMYCLGDYDRPSDYDGNGALDGRRDGCPSEGNGGLSDGEA